MTARSTVQRFGEFLRFAVVGVSGIVVNLGLFYALTRWATVPLEVASPIAIEISVLWNYALNDRWTFALRQTAGAQLTRLVRFHVVSLAAGAINYALLLALARIGWWDIAANLAGIAAGAAVKFGINSSWTWRELEADAEAAPFTLPQGRVE